MLTFSFTDKGRDCSSRSKQVGGSSIGGGGGCGGSGGGDGVVSMVTPCSPCSKSMSPNPSHHSNHSDVGYSSGQEGSQPGSRDGSDVACHEGLCNHDGKC